MKEWLVTIPIVGFAVLTIGAEDSEQAIRKGLDTVKFEDVDEWKPDRNLIHDIVNGAKAEEV